MSEQQENNKKRVPYNPKLEEPFVFDGICSTKYVSTAELMKMVSQVFHALFVDYEGCILERSGQELTLALIFNHGEYDSGVRGVTRGNAVKTGVSVLDKTRHIDYAAKEGDRYNLTEDGKDVVTNLLSRKYYNYGKPNFGTLVNEFSDRGISNYYNTYSNQYTKVSGIAIDRMCSLLYGDELEGEELAYLFGVVYSMPDYSYGPIQNNSNNGNYILGITRIWAKELKALNAKLGINTGGINIVR